MVKSITSRAIQVPKHRRPVVVLLNELDHDLAPLAVGGTVIEMRRAPTMLAVTQLDVLCDVIGAGAVQCRMIARRRNDVGHEISYLSNGPKCMHEALRHGG